MSCDDCYRMLLELVSYALHNVVFCFLVTILDRRALSDRM